MGTFGITDERALPLVASALTLPAFACSLIVVTASNIISHLSAQHAGARGGAFLVRHVHDVDVRPST